METEGKKRGEKEARAIDGRRAGSSSRESEEGGRNGEKRCGADGRELARHAEREASTNARAADSTIPYIDLTAREAAARYPGLGRPSGVKSRTRGRTLGPVLSRAGGQKRHLSESTSVSAMGRSSTLVSTRLDRSAGCSDADCGITLAPQIRARGAAYGEAPCDCRSSRPPSVLSLLALLAFSSESESHGRVRYYYPYYSAWPYWGGYYGYPAFYYGGFYGAPYPYARAYYGYSDRAPSAVRLEVNPVEAEVYVDGYLAGIVDEFDGFFQRLNLTPGAHEIVIYLDGHRSIREKLYLSPGGSYKLRRAMEPLAPGEANAPRPSPPPEPEPEIQAAVESRPAPSPSVSGFGVLELRIQPADAEIVIDGKPWPSDGVPRSARDSRSRRRASGRDPKGGPRAFRDRRPHRSR